MKIIKNIFLLFFLGNLFLSVNIKQTKQTDFLKFIYLKNGEALDASYNPCNCRNSIWKDDTISAFYLEKNDFNKFYKLIEQKKLPTVNSFADFSIACIYRKKDKVDTIYISNNLAVFTKKREPPTNKSYRNFPKNFIFKYCYNFNCEDFLPREFILKHRIARYPPRQSEH